ncbi:MAG: hypothetical protein KKF56_00530 [Nanoarchaeota archaeon]|nr:hypothetical protein [Nanoarchaeota archaeon]
MVKVGEFIQTLEKNKEYGEFRKKNSDAPLCAGFFVLDLGKGKNAYQLDYYLKNKKVETFDIDGKKVVRNTSQHELKKVPQEIKGDINIDLDMLKGIVADEMKNRGVTEKVSKIIAVLQQMGKEKVWILNCMTNGMDIIKVHVADNDKSILEFEKFSLMDVIKQVK